MRKIRKIPHARKAAERLSRRWLQAAGVPRHFVGFSANEGFYLVIHMMCRGAIYDYPVPCWGAHALKLCVDELLRDWKRTSARSLKEAAE